MCVELISKINEFITTCGHSYHKKCRDEYERKSWKTNTWKCHVCDEEQTKLFQRRKSRTKKNKDFEIDVLVIENQNQENKTFFNDPMYIVREHLYKFLQFGKFVLLRLLLKML